MMVLLEGNAEHRKLRKKRVAEASGKRSRQKVRTRQALRMEPFDPRSELLTRARSGDASAAATADELFGTSWRSP